MAAAMQISTRLAYEIRGEGTPVVLLHGLTFDRTAWRPISERLGDSVQTIAVDLPAHGESAGPPVALGELAARIHELLTSLGIDRPVVVGHSISGSLVFLYAHLYPTLGVVDVDQPLDIRGFATLLHRLEPALRGPGFAAAFEQFQQSMAIDRVPEPFRSLVLDSQRVHRDVVVGYWDDVLRADPDDLQALIDTAAGGLRVPCLAIFGHALTDAPGHGLTRVRDLELEEWADHGHFPHLVDPDRFAARLRTFVERVAI